MDVNKFGDWDREEKIQKAAFRTAVGAVIAAVVALFAAGGVVIWAVVSLVNAAVAALGS